MMNFEKKDNLDIATFSVKKIDALVADQIRDQIIKIFENANSRVIIDLRGVEYIDSSGFGCFLSISKAAKSNYGILKFANPEAQVMSLFKTLYLHTIFEIFDNIESCIRSFK
jgi:anti-sigma B factor antagonist